jgi:3-oxoacyl-[acyl-carrier protein] reductase
VTCTSETPLRRLFAAAVERFGSVDNVVANAGLELLGVPIADLSDEQIDNLVNVNARDALLTMQRAARGTSPTTGGSSNITSTAIAIPQAGVGLYSATKAAGPHFAQVLARELAGRGITVNNVMPGPIDQAGVFIDSIPTDSPFRDQQAEGAWQTASARPAMSPTLPNISSATLAAWVSGTTIGVTGGLPQ